MPGSGFTVRTFASPHDSDVTKCMRRFPLSPLRSTLLRSGHPYPRVLRWTTRLRIRRSLPRPRVPPMTPPPLAHLALSLLQMLERYYLHDVSVTYIVGVLTVACSSTTSRALSCSVSWPSLCSEVNFRVFIADFVQGLAHARNGCALTFADTHFGVLSNSSAIQSFCSDRVT